MDSAFGSRLRRFREAKKLTLQQVPDAVGCTKAYIWKLEMRGQRPSAERVLALTKVLGVTMEDNMGVPIHQVPEASPEDVAFFRAYAGMHEDDKTRVRQALLDYQPKTKLGQKLLALRQAHVAMGGELLSADALDEEMRSRRGEADDV